jgi:tRNA threonylcarbamoyladenosine modification (KEOPS) complex Cgi121 subunit
MIHALKKYETAINTTRSLLNEMLVYSWKKGIKQVDKRC